MKGTGFFEELTNFASLSSVWIVNISCEQLWADHDCAESWVSSAGPARPRCPGALYSSPAQCHEPLPSFLLQPVTMSQAVGKNSKNWLDVKETFTARVGTINEYILAPVARQMRTPVLKDRGYTSRADIKIMKCPICHPFKTMWKLADKSPSSEWRQHGPERRAKT